MCRFLDVTSASHEELLPLCLQVCRLHGVIEIAAQNVRPPLEPRSFEDLFHGRGHLRGQADRHVSIR